MYFSTVLIFFISYHSQSAIVDFLNYVTSFPVYNHIHNVNMINDQCKQYEKVETPKMFKIVQART